MNFPDAIRSALRNYATFAGRARRSEFWFFYLFLLLCQVGASMVDGVADGAGLVSGLISLALFLPMLAVGVRRLHDTGRSGWWMLVGLVPLIGWIFVLIWYCRQGEAGPNRFGADPKGSDGRGTDGRVLGRPWQAN